MPRKQRGVRKTRQRKMTREIRQRRMIPKTRRRIITRKTRKQKGAGGTRAMAELADMPRGPPQLFRQRRVQGRRQDADEHGLYEFPENVDALPPLPPRLRALQQVVRGQRPERNHDDPAPAPHEGNPPVELVNARPQEGNPPVQLVNARLAHLRNERPPLDAYANAAAAQLARARAAADQRRRLHPNRAMVPNRVDAYGNLLQ